VIDLIRSDPIIRKDSPMDYSPGIGLFSLGGLNCPYFLFKFDFSNFSSTGRGVEISQMPDVKTNMLSDLVSLYWRHDPIIIPWPILGKLLYSYYKNILL